PLATSMPAPMIMSERRIDLASRIYYIAAHFATPARMRTLACVFEVSDPIVSDLWRAAWSDASARAIPSNGEIRADQVFRRSAFQYQWPARAAGPVAGPTNHSRN